MSEHPTVLIRCPLCNWGTATTEHIPASVVLALLKHIAADHCNGMELPPSLEPLLHDKLPGELVSSVNGPFGAKL